MSPVRSRAGVVEGTAVTVRPEPVHRDDAELLQAASYLRFALEAGAAFWMVLGELDFLERDLAAGLGARGSAERERERDIELVRRSMRRQMLQ